MKKTPILVVAVLLAVVGAAIFAFQSTPGLDDRPSPTNPAGADAATTTGPAPAGGVTLDRTSRAASDPARRADDGSGATGGDDPSLPALVGMVVDETGAPVGDAVVSSLAIGNGMRGAFDFTSFDFTDPMQMRERMQQFANEQRETRTDAEGRFRLVPKGSGAQTRLRVRARGHRILDQGATVPTEADVDLGTLQLRRAAVVAGRVVDATGQPIAGASVTRQNSGDRRLPGPLEAMGLQVLAGADTGEDALTDDSGRFELSHVEPGDFSLAAHHPDHPLARLENLSVAEGATLRDVLVVAEVGASIAGRVTGIPAGTEGVRVVAARVRDDSQAQGMQQLLGGALEELGVGLGERTVRPDPDGAFTLRGLTIGQRYQVYAVQSGKGFTGAALCSERLERMAGTEGIELEYEAGTSVTFTAIDSETGKPVEQLWVRDRLRGGGGLGELMAMAGDAMTRLGDYPDGEVVLPNLRPKTNETLELTLEAIGYARFEKKDIDVSRPGAVDLGTLELTPAPVVAVTVVRQDGGQPVADARVRLNRAGRGGRPFGGFPIPGAAGGTGPHEGTTDFMGRCTLNSHAGAEATLVIEAEGFARFETAMQLPENEDVTFRAELVAGGSVVVTCLDVDDTPMGNTRIEHRGAAGERGDATTGDDGTATFARLSPGVHRFRLASRTRGRGLAALMGGRGGGGNDGEPWQEVTVTDGGTAQLILSKAPTATLTGFVRENGVPVAAARVSFAEGPATDAGTAQGNELAAAMERMGRGGGNRTRSDDNGRYELRELPAGEHRLQVSHGDRAMTTTVRVFLRNGPNVLDVNLDTAVLRGTVLDPEGNPVAGASISVRPAGEANGAQDMIAAGMRAISRGRGPDPGRASDEQGAFELRGVQPDTSLVVTAQASGFAPATSKPITVAPGGEGTVELRLVAAGKIEVTAEGVSPFMGVMATYDGNDAQGVPPVMAMLRRGSGTLEGLRPGPWKVALTQMGGGNQDVTPQLVEVVANQTASVRF